MLVVVEVAAVEAQEACLDSFAALMRSSWYSGWRASTVNIATV